MFDVNARFVAMNMNALKVSKNMCKDCLLVNYSLFNFPGKIVFNGGGGGGEGVDGKFAFQDPAVQHSGVIKIKLTPSRF